VVQGATQDRHASQAILQGGESGFAAFAQMFDATDGCVVGFFYAKQCRVFSFNK
jgi:hypothetical protein